MKNPKNWLNPYNRTFYTSIFNPPSGMVIDEVIATTYSLNLFTLLEAQLYLKLLDGEKLFDPINIFESIQKKSSRITVYVQNGSIHYPKFTNKNSHLMKLIGLLDEMTIGVSAPKGGVFHPKIWAIKFRTSDIPSGDVKELYRLVVLSRNISDDKSWDLSLQLEGEIPDTKKLNKEHQKEIFERNEPLVQFFKTLPEWVQQGADQERIERTLKFAEELRRVEWTIPNGFCGMKFHFSGMNNFEWTPQQSKKLAVISPFCKDDALNSLIEQTGEPKVRVLVFKI